MCALSATGSMSTTRLLLYTCRKRLFSLTVVPLISKRKGQLNDACASKHMKMAPEVAMDNAEAIHLYAQEWVQALHRNDKMTRCHICCFMTYW